MSTVALHTVQGALFMPDIPSLICGIDPGGSGGIAMLAIDKSWVDLFPMPETRGDLAQILEEYAPKIQIVILENVHSFPGQGVASAFTFGKSAGLLIGLLLGLKIPFEEISPMKWQGAMGCQAPRKPKNPTTTTDSAPTSTVVRSSNTEKKNRTKAKAQELFPKLRITHATADALLLAEFGRRRALGMIQQKVS